MKTKYIDVDGYWGIVLIYDFDDSDEYELYAIMDSFGLSTRRINKALQILSNKNSGMAISRENIRMSAIFISHTTSTSEWWNTLNHELYHCCVAIIDYYGEPYDEEPAAYLQGHLMRQAIEGIGEPCI